MTDPIAVEFECQVRKVQSMSDHSVNVTLNLPEYAIDQASWFMKRIDAAVKAVVVETE